MAYNSDGLHYSFDKQNGRKKKEGVIKRELIFFTIRVLTFHTLEYIKLKNLTSYNNIKTFLFSTLNTSIPLSKPKQKPNQNSWSCFVS